MSTRACLVVLGDETCTACYVQHGEELAANLIYGWIAPELIKHQFSLCEPEYIREFTAKEEIISLHRFEDKYISDIDAEICIFTKVDEEDNENVDVVIKRTAYIDQDQDLH